MPKSVKSFIVILSSVVRVVFCCQCCSSGCRRWHSCDPCPFLIAAGGGVAAATVGSAALYRGPSMKFEALGPRVR